MAADALLESDFRANILLIEPFYGGSHKQLLDLLHEEIPHCVRYTMPAKKWHWRARTAALYMSQVIPANEDYKVLFCSSVLNLAELIALRPDLSKLHKVLYFHENQLVYPVKKQQDRDFQYGYNQVLSCLVSDEVVFNSQFNMDSFLNNIKSYMKLIPDHRPTGLAESIRPKCRVLYFPVKFPAPLSSSQAPSGSISSDAAEETGSVVHQVETGNVPTQETLQKQSNTQERPLHIVWPHRWEHDKDPELFFQTLYQLKEESCDFTVSVLGETYTDVPEVFEEARKKLSDHIDVWGYQTSKEAYYAVLRRADVVVSTAKHEFFGVAMLEATHLGCYPLCPNALVYPEIFPAQCLYNTPNQLLKKLRHFCRKPGLVKNLVPQLKINTHKFSWETLSQEYRKLLERQAVSEERETTRGSDERMDSSSQEGRFFGRRLGSLGMD